jgi:NADPH-dependent 2,4-dienoyl-CoA reductase/sulfur reductase-like enzyme
MIGAELHPPYDRPPLSKEYLHEGPDSTTPLFPGAADLASEFGITLRSGTRATALRPADHVVTVAGGAMEYGDIVDEDTENEDIEYDALLVATGVQARSLPGTEILVGVHQLRTVEDAAAIRAGLDAGARTVVIGGGFIGAEVASAAVRRGLRPTVLEAAPTPLVRAVGDTAGAALASLHERYGTEFRCGVGVEHVLGDDHVTAVRLSDGSEIPADMVVVGIGADPATDWLESSGLALDDGLVCSPTLTAGSDIWGAGDVVRWHNPLFDRSMRVEHWTNAGEQATHAMINLLAPAAATPYGHVPYFWSDWYGRRIQFAGLPIGEPELVSGAWDADSFVALYRDGDRLIGVLTLDRRGDIMKYRALIARSAHWDTALDLARKRNSATARA